MLDKAIGQGDKRERTVQVQDQTVLSLTKRGCSKSCSSTDTRLDSSLSEHPNVNDLDLGEDGRSSMELMKSVSVTVVKTSLLELLLVSCCWVGCRFESGPLMLRNKTCFLAIISQKR